MIRPIPKQQAPELKFSLLDGNQWELKKQTPENFTLIVFYRGLHCPVCKHYLEEMQALSSAFNAKGVDLVAVSMDSERRAKVTSHKWDISKLILGYNLEVDIAKQWGLYFSKATQDGEPEIFSEPGLFLIDKNNEVYYSSVTSNPWGRPYLPSLVKALDFILKNNYPARGEFVPD